MTVKERIRLILLAEKIQDHPEFQNIISVSLVPTKKKEEAGKFNQRSGFQLKDDRRGL